MIVAQNGQLRTYRVSGVSTDFPAALLKLCDAMLQNASARVALCDEPGGAILEVAADPAQHHTTLLSIYEIDEHLIAFDTLERTVLALRPENLNRVFSTLSGPSTLFAN